MSYIIGFGVRLFRSFKYCFYDVHRRDTHVKVGDIVNIVGEFDESGCCCISNDKNFIVAEPDTLLSGTSVVSSIHCMRRYVGLSRFA